jgi:hypothetical protein
MRMGSPINPEGFVEYPFVALRPWTGWAGGTTVSGSTLVLPLVEAPTPILSDAKS